MTRIGCCFMLFVTFQLCSLAQQPGRTIDDIMPQVRAQIATHNASLPNFSCEERITSQETHHGKIKRQIGIESTIRVIRNSSKSGEGLFHEARKIHTVDGKRPKQPNVNVPLMLWGGFGEDFNAFLGAEHWACYQHQLVSNGTPEGRELLVLELALRSDFRTVSACSGLIPDFSAQFWLDPQSLRLVKLASQSPNENVSGFRNLITTIDYGVVTLGTEEHWLPVRVRASLTNASTDQKILYTADYGNCHRFEVTDRLLPSSDLLLSPGDGGDRP